MVERACVVSNHLFEKVLTWFPQQGITTNRHDDITSEIWVKGLYLELGLAQGEIQTVQIETKAHRFRKVKLVDALLTLATESQRQMLKLDFPVFGVANGLTGMANVILFKSVKNNLVVFRNDMLLH